MEWYVVFSIFFVIGWVVFVLVLMGVSVHREEEQLIKESKFVLYKLGKKQYALVRTEDYLPEHSMIPRDDVIRYFSCDSGKIALQIILRSHLAKSTEIFNATEEDIWN